MNEEQLKNIMTEFSLPSWREIPDVGLYLDQVVKYINGFLKDFPEMQATGSMLSNYVKMKLVSSPIKKTYSRDQIASFLFIVMAKTVLTMDHIRICLNNIKAFSDSEEAYELFRTQLCRELSSLVSDTEPVSSMQSVKARQSLANIVITAAHKMYLERWFDQFQTELPEQSGKKAIKTGKRLKQAS